MASRCVNCMKRTSGCALLNYDIDTVIPYRDLLCFRIFSAQVTVCLNLEVAVAKTVLLCCAT